MGLSASSSVYNQTDGNDQEWERDVCHLSDYTLTGQNITAGKNRVLTDERPRYLPKNRASTAERTL